MTDLNSSADHSTLLHEDHDLLRTALAKFTKTTIFAINRLYHGTLDGRDSGGMTGTVQAGPNEAVYLIYLLVNRSPYPSLLSARPQFHIHLGRVCSRRDPIGERHVRGR